MNEELINQLATIIRDYRKEELDIPLDGQHVKNWLSQFDEDCRGTILKETVAILQEWYFSYKEIDSFINSVLSYLCTQLSFTENELIHKALFLDAQRKRNSQTRIIQRLNSMINNRYGEEIISTGKSSDGIYVYLDDGLYTGAKARKELSSIISNLHAGDSLYVFFFIAGTNGLRHSEKKLKEEAENHSVKLKMFRMHPVPNDRTTFITDEDGQTVINYYPKHSCLWPTEEVQEVPSIKEYIKSSIDIKKNKEKFMYRNGHWKDDPGIFTSVEGRNIVEREFLKKGIDLVLYSKDNGLYPLGFNAWPSLGFGSFCATCMNISNTCPLVLWWGNVEKKGDVLDNWYPLLPRRVVDEIYTVSFEDIIEEKIQYNSTDEHYSVCSDCGRVFGTIEEHEKPFCVDCEWKH